nr:unnamed protein product [Digitaria exilis]
MITIDDLMRSCGAGAPVPSGDGQQATPRQQMVATGSELHQLTVSKIRTAVSMLGRRTGHARFRRGPIAVAEHPPPSDDHRQQRSAAGGVTLDFAKACDGEKTAFSGSASGASSSLPSTTTLTSLTAGEGSVSNARFPPVSGHHVAGNKLQPPVTTSMQQQQEPAVSDYYTTVAAGRSKCHDRARSENDVAGGKAHASRCHCSKKR